MKRALLLVALASPVCIAPALAENSVVKCKTGKATRAAPVAGPALVANVPKSMTPIDLNAVQFTDKPLTRQMVVEGLFARRTDTDTVEVTARLVNCTDKPLQIRARSSFMDETQAPTEPVSAWTQVFLPAKGTGTYRELSMSRDEVKYYLIEVAPAD